MAGTTSNYSFPYPTSTDLVRNGASAIQSLADGIDSFISGSEAAGKLFDIAADNLVTGGTVAWNTTAAGTAIATAPNSVTFSTGKSGLFVLVTQWRGSFANATTSLTVSPNISGAVTQASAINTSSSASNTTNACSGSFIQIIDNPTPANSITVNLHAWVGGTPPGSGNAFTFTWSRTTVLALG